DVVITLLLLPIAAVIVGICAILIKLFSPGPVFYHQTRVGKDGQHFTFTKLRTMIPDAERDTGPVWATEDDPRITRIGNILRKTRLDEVPQLWQVLTGEMSLAGPRPERPEIVERLRKEIPLYEMRQIVRPGITGWAQVNHKYDASTEDVIEKLRYDLYYIRNLSLGLDLQIVLRTFGVMLGKKGAH
ncbi:MAG: sugar transferase, partial [candidate division WS1 bacterium]|nr:sugar transferase [candidate division WS1 bacterium]